MKNLFVERKRLTDDREKLNATKACFHSERPPYWVYKHVQCWFAIVNKIFIFVLFHEITTKLLEKDLPHIILISARDTNIYFRLKNLHVNYLRENLPLVVENMRWKPQTWPRGLVTWLLDEARIGTRIGTSWFSVRTHRPLTRTCWPQAKYFPVRPSHSVNKYTLSGLMG